MAFKSRSQSPRPEGAEGVKNLKRRGVMAWLRDTGYELEGETLSKLVAGLLVNQKEEKDLCLARD
jgi:hypothetical protein